MEELSRKSKKYLIFCFSYGIVYFVCVGNYAYDKTNTYADYRQGAGESYFYG